MLGNAGTITYTFGMSNVPPSVPCFFRWSSLLPLGGDC
uniref:Uncharacterized protein n=1 Tax=Arundo donax TaxID=35708 RepID=A0A0A9GYX1_ARUDO